MRTRLTLFLGIFTVMALSNAIVPVLPSYDAGSSLQGLIYAAYFLGAFVITLPAGILSDRFGRIPIIRLGLAVTVTSGLFLAMTSSAVPVIALRFTEGIGAGLFVAAAMAAVNRDPDHLRMSGWFMAWQNAGLVLGLVLAGWLAVNMQAPAAGILLYALVAFIPAAGAFFVSEEVARQESYEPETVTGYLREYNWLWYTSLVLIGITGVMTSLYPEFSGVSYSTVGSWIAGMSIATIAAVIVCSRTRFPPVPVFRWSALLMAAAVILSFFTPAGLIAIGALAGVVMFAVMAYLAHIREHQGIVMGLFATTGYLGMAILPAIAGFVAEGTGFFVAFCFTAGCAVTVALAVSRSFYGSDW